MKTKIAIEIDSEYLPSLHALLYREMKEAHELTEDERFTKKFPNLTERALLAERNLAAILGKLEEQF